MGVRAYHMIGFSHMDTGRMLHNEYHPEILAHVRERYQQISLAGQLLPGGRSEALATEPGRMFHLDHLAGDSSFIFLSIGKRYWQPVEVLNFGFIFDAEQLVQRGAILRSRDLLADYEDLLESVVQQFIPFHDPAKWTPEQQQALFRSLSDDATEEDLEKIPSNDEHYSLTEAVEKGQVDGHPLAAQAIQELKERIAAQQKQVQYTGEEALQLLRTGKAQGYELLVQDSLSLSLAVAHIVEGQE